MIRIRDAHLYVEKYDGKNLLLDFVQEKEFIYFRHNGDYVPTMSLREYQPTQLLFGNVSELNLKGGDIILFPMETLLEIRQQQSRDYNHSREQKFSTIAFEIENGALYLEDLKKCSKIKHSKKKELEYRIKTTWQDGSPRSLEYPYKIRELHVLDVGQGSANFIFGDESYLTVFDFGTSIYASSAEIRTMLGGYSCCLRDYNTSLIISHWDCDHYNLVTFLGEDVLKGLCCVVVPELALSLTAKQTAKRLETYCRHLVSFVSPKAKRRGKVGLQLIRENLNYQLFIGERSNDINKSGLALNIYGDGGMVMLTADHINSQVWQDMYLNKKKHTEDKELHIVVPHHGGACGRVDKKISLKKAGTAAISVGKNFYKHPNQNTVDYYEQLGFEIKRTDWERRDIIIQL